MEVKATNKTRYDYSDIINFIEQKYSIKTRDFNQAVIHNKNNYQSFLLRKGYTYSTDIAESQRQTAEFYQDSDGYCKNIESLDFWAWLLKNKNFLFNVKKKGCMSYVDIKIEASKWIKDPATPDFVKTILTYIQVEYGDNVQCLHTW